MADRLPKASIPLQVALEDARVREVLQHPAACSPPAPRRSLRSCPACRGRLHACRRSCRPLREARQPLLCPSPIELRYALQLPYRLPRQRDTQRPAKLPFAAFPQLPALHVLELFPPHPLYYCLCAELRPTGLLRSLPKTGQRYAGWPMCRSSGACSVPPWLPMPAPPRPAKGPPPR